MKKDSAKKGSTKKGSPKRVSPKAPSPSRQPWSAHLLANLAVFGVVVFAYVLDRVDPDLYYRILQEDEFLEWSTFWAFIAAASFFVWASIGQRRSGRPLPWFFGGVALFCFLVAMEEISWGQRVLGYRPPAYFLEHNFQQELNIHNVFSTGLRRQTLKAIILGYGVLLPLVSLPAWLRSNLDRVGITAPPVALVPAFFATYLTYQIYPWQFSGELVELMLGLGFLFAARYASYLYKSSASRGLQFPWKFQAVACIGVIALGVGTASVSRIQLGDSHEIIAATRTEAEALRRDFLDMARRNRGRLVTRCGLHKRVYTYVQEYKQDYLRDGTFNALTEKGLPEERAAFFLDPWNSPYWIRHECGSRGQRDVFVYSFGPNRRRESSENETLGDDIGVIISQLPASPRRRRSAPAFLAAPDHLASPAKPLGVRRLAAAFPFFPRVPDRLRPRAKGGGKLQHSEELLARFDSDLAAIKTAMAGYPDAKLMQQWSLKAGGHVLFTLPRVAVIRSMILNHIIHHRGQLSVYLRLNDIPVPAIYGPSADEAS